MYLAGLRQRTTWDHKRYEDIADLQDIRLGKLNVLSPS